MPTHHHLEADPRTVAWGHWDATVEPVLYVESGDTVTIDTLSGGPDDMPPGGPTLPGHADVHAQKKRDPGPHFLTGPVHVAGAEPGDGLEVEILDITLREDVGWNVQLPLWGTLPEDFPHTRRIHIPIDRAAMTAAMPWGGTLALKPFFGCMGVAPPPNWGRCSSVEPRAFGGNMDNKELVTGVTVTFPVFNEGALFSAGDGHAVQGDGEVCVSALETSLTGTFRLTVRKGAGLKVPRAESATELITMAFDTDLDDAAKDALREMIALIGERAGLAPADAYTLCSLAADMRVTQLVDLNKGIHCVLPKAALP
ncbi:MAG: acetamidase/formamidase family protein [Acuticoccus sp.]